MIEIIIEGAQVTTFRGSKGEFRKQAALVVYSNGERRRWNIGLNDGQPPFADGSYTLADGDVYAGKYGPEISGWPKLRPIVAAKAKAA